MDPKPTHPVATKPRILTILGSVVVALLLLVGCGDDDTVDDAAATVDEQVDEVDDAEAEEAQDDLVSGLESLGLSSLASAVADIDISQLTDAEQYTFLAPNDEAFASLTADDLADLLGEPDLLVTTLRNHVIDEALQADELAERATVTTSGGEELTVTQSDDALTVGGATVVEADRSVGEGVVHVVDAFILAEAP